MKTFKSRLFFLTISVMILALFGVISCTPAEDVVPAPETTPTHGPPSQYSPAIQAASAHIKIDDNILSNDVVFDINNPGYYLDYNWAGNFIFYLDVAIPDTPGQQATTAEGTYQSTYDNFVSWPDLSPGSHSFSVQLVTPSLAPLEPHMHANIELEVPAAGTARPVIDSLSVQTLCRPGYTPRQPHRLDHRRRRRQRDARLGRVARRVAGLRVAGPGGTLDPTSCPVAAFERDAAGLRHHPCLATDI